MSPERPEQDDDFLEDEEQEEFGQRSIFATGWFRAVLVLLVLAVIAVIAVPLIGGWFEPTPPPKVATRPSEPAPAIAPSTPTPTTPAPSQMPSTAAPPIAPPPAVAPTPAPPPALTTPAPAPMPPPPAVATPAPARPELPATTAPKAGEKATAPERTAAVTPGKSAAKPAAGGSYWVQVGAFKESGNAESLAKKLRAEGFTVQVTRVTRDEPLHVVRVGGYPDRSRATAAREELQGKGHPGFVASGPAK